MNIKVLIFFLISCTFGLLAADEPMILSLQQAEELAIQNNYELNASLHALEQGYYGYRSAKDYFLPSLQCDVDASTGNDQHAVDSAVTLSQPLFNRTASYQIKGAEIEWEQLRLEVQKKICDILFQVREAYHAVILNQAHLAVDQTVINIWKDELQRQERHLELGATIPYEINQSQLHLKNAWIDYYATQKDIRTSQYALLTILGLSPEICFEILEKEIPLPCAPINRGTIEQWKTWTLQYNPGLKQQQFECLLSDVRIKQARAERYPTFSLYASAGHGYIINGFYQNSYAAAGVSMDWMLYDWSNKQRIKQAQEGSREASCHYYQVQLEAESQVFALWSEIEHSWQSYEAAMEGARLAEEGIRMATKKRQVGLMSAFEYRDAIKVMHEAQQTVNQAKYDIRNAYDQLVQHAGIDLKGNCQYPTLSS